MDRKEYFKIKNIKGQKQKTGVRAVYRAIGKDFSGMS